MFGSYFENRRVRRIFRKYVSAEAADSLASGKPLPDSGMKARKIELVLAFVRGQSLEQTSDNIALVTDLSMKHGWTAETIVSALIVTTSWLNATSNHDPAAKSRTDLVSELRRQLTTNIKIIHGA